MSAPTDRLQRSAAGPLALVALALAGTVGGGALAGLVIAVHALAVRDADATTRFALAVAEPLALLGTAVVTALGARRLGRWRRAAEGRLAGVATAAAMVLFAFWVGDADRWTAAAALLLPVVGWLAAGGAGEAVASSRRRRPPAQLSATSGSGGSASSPRASSAASAGTSTSTPRALGPMKPGPKIPTRSFPAARAGMPAAPSTATATSASKPDANVATAIHSVLDPGRAKLPLRRRQRME